MGITNAPQGSGGGSGGGEWVERAANNDWTDMFEINGSIITAKKDIYMWLDNTPALTDAFIPKGLSMHEILLPLTGVEHSLTNAYFDIGKYTAINPTRVQSSQGTLAFYKTRLSFTYDGSNIVISSTNTSSQINKSSIHIYTRD